MSTTSKREAEAGWKEAQQTSEHIQSTTERARKRKRKRTHLWERRILAPDAHDHGRHNTSRNELGGGSHFTHSPSFQRLYQYSAIIAFTHSLKTLVHPIYTCTSAGHWPPIRITPWQCFSCHSQLSSVSAFGEWMDQFRIGSSWTTRRVHCQKWAQEWMCSARCSAVSQSADRLGEHCPAPDHLCLQQWVSGALIELNRGDWLSVQQCDCLERDCRRIGVGSHIKCQVATILTGYPLADCTLHCACRQCRLLSRSPGRQSTVLITRNNNKTDHCSDYHLQCSVQQLQLPQVRWPSTSAKTMAD